MSCRVAVDAMGGDRAPGVVIRGAVDAISADESLSVVLVGDERRIADELSALNGYAGRPDVVHASEAIGMDEHPVESVRRKRDSSLLRLAELAASGEADAVVSAGNSGAYAAACQLRLRPLPCISRPGIAVTIPTFFGPFVLCDAGANINAKPHQLHEYAVMASLYAERLLDVENPRTALLSIGEESIKGTDLIRQAHRRLADDSNLEFVGNLEARQLFSDVCDVAVCDGFVGNVVLKLAEGLAEGLLNTVEHELGGSREAVDERFGRVLNRIRQQHDYSEYGGAPLLGIDGACIICHGRSNERAIRNAIATAARFRTLGINEAIAARLG